MVPKHYVCAVIWRKNQETKRNEVLIQNVISSYIDREGVRRKTLPQPKFVGGMQRMAEDSLEVTLTREIVEETYLRYSGALHELGDPIPVYDRDNPSVVDHFKHAFLVNYDECTGELRTETIIDVNDEMFPPRWVPVDEAGREVYHTHQPILLRAQDNLAFF